MWECLYKAGYEAYSEPWTDHTLASRNRFLNQQQSSLHFGAHAVFSQFWLWPGDRGYLELSPAGCIGNHLTVSGFVRQARRKRPYAVGQS